MSAPDDDGAVGPGEFPFPLSEGPHESPFLTWLRNHSNYVAERGFLDYLRLVAVLLRGISINALSVLPWLLTISLAVSLLYGGLLTDWDGQAAKESNSVHLAQIAYVCDQRAMAHVTHVTDAKAPWCGDSDLKAIEGSAPPRAARLTRKTIADSGTLHRAVLTEKRVDWSTRPIDRFLTDTVTFDDTGWVKWVQDWAGGLLKPPFLLTPLVLVLAAAWVLAFPVFTTMARITGQRRSIETGSYSSVTWRDRFERTFGGALLVVCAVALFEMLPLIVHYEHRFRVARFHENIPWREIGAAALALGGLSGAPKLLSALSGVWQKLAIAVVAILGVAAPLAVIVLVCEYLVYTSQPVNTYPILIRLFLVIPGIFALVILLALALGMATKAFSGREIRQLLLVGVRVVAGNAIILLALGAIYDGLFYLYATKPALVPQILLAVHETRRLTLASYGDLAAYVVFGWTLQILVFCWLTVDVNLTSMHGWFRDRIATAYLLGRDAKGRVAIERDVRLSELSSHHTGTTAPYHLLNATLNLQGSKDPDLRDRRSDFFIFSKRFIGGPRTGYCATPHMEDVFPQIDLAGAMAISAAAAAPNMGRSTSPALVLFMALINVRLGVWIPNPGILEESGKDRKLKRRPRRLDQQLGLSFENDVFRGELASVKDRWEHLGARAAGRTLVSPDAPTPANTLAGIGFSGGGIRSATVNLGIAQALQHVGIFDQFDYMSTVSGGGFLGSSISTHMRSKDTRVVQSVAPRLSIAAERQAAEAKSFGNRFDWRVRPTALLREMTMSLDEVHRWVNVSDGGHIENLATIELLRRRCRLIVTGDGEADPLMRFNGLATLIRTARIDLGVEIDICVDEMRLARENRCTREHFAIGRITYPGEAAESRYGYLLYVKSSCTGDEDEVIHEYRSRHPDFPQESTADQFFDEGQFEAYRSLGQHIGDKAIAALGAADVTTFEQLAQCFEASWRQEELRRAELTLPSPAA